METLARDLRLTLRSLAKKPTFAAIAMLSLALGIGANTTVFTIANEIFLRPLPVAEADQLVAIHTLDEKFEGTNPLSHLNWKDIRQQNRVFDEVLAHDWAAMSVAAGSEAEVVFGQMVSANYFDALGIEPAHGRTFAGDEDEPPGAHPVAMLGHRFWSERLGADPAWVGRTLRINAHPFTVVGIAPASFGGLTLAVEPELWVPMSMHPVIRQDEGLNWYETRRGLFLFAYARLAPGVSLEEAESNLEVIGARLQEEYPDDNKGRTFGVEPLATSVVPGGARQGIGAATAMLMVIVALVLLIACANIANLLLARASERRREVAVRLAMGAARGRLVRQLLTESLVVALGGGVLGLLVALWARGVLRSYLPSLPLPVTVELDLALDVRVLAFTFALSLATGLLFGLAPALQSTRPELVGSLKEGADFDLGLGRKMSARNLLVIGQVALCLVALAGAGLFLRSLAEAQRSDPGFETRRLLAVTFDLGLQGYGEEEGRRFLETLAEEVRALPGVERVSMAQAGPLQSTLMRSVFFEGAESEGDRTLVQVNLVEPPYFETVGIPVLRGRPFLESDREGSVPVVIVNETMARRYWPGEEALGQRFTFFGDEQPVEVVGVARDAKYQTLGEEPQPYIYQPLAQEYTAGLTLLGRTANDPRLALSSVERTVRALDPDLPLMAIDTAAERLGRSLWAARLGASLLSIFGILALALAAIGIYGVMSFAVERRRREIGIRMALGAARETVLRMILRQGLGLVTIGLLVGLGLAFAATRTVSSLLFVSPLDPLAFAGTLALLLAAALAATLLPARRATGVDPIQALRYD